MIANITGRAQNVEESTAREPTGTAPKPTVDVEQLPYEQLTALETPETDAQVCCECDDTRKVSGASDTLWGRRALQSFMHKLPIIVQAALADIGSADWAIACRGLLNIRRLSKHHTQQCRALL